MKLSSAEGAKLLKKLKSEYDALKSKESISSTFLTSVGEILIGETEIRL